MIQMGFLLVNVHPNVLIKPPFGIAKHKSVTINAIQPNTLTIQRILANNVQKDVLVVLIIQNVLLVIHLNIH